MVSGPGTVTFANANSLTTTATFSVAGSYVLKLTASDSLLSSSDDVSITVNAQNQLTIPTAPSNLVATAVDAHNINLHWNDNSNNEAGFRVEGSQDGATFIEYQQKPANVTDGNDWGLDEGHTYWYRVRAYNANGNSAYSNVAQVITSQGGGQDTQAPTRPTNLRMLSRTRTRINVAWNASSDNVGVTDYKMDVSLNASFTNLVRDNVSLGNVTSYNITGLQRNTFYYMRVKALDAAGNVSNNSSTLSRRTNN